MIETDPKALPNSAWADDVQQLPKIDDGKLFSYILRIKVVDVDCIEKCKDQKAYSYWMSGFVDTVFVAKCPSNNKLIFLKGKVSPSQRLNEDSHEVWVCIENSNTDCRIVTSWCTCTAGTAEACRLTMLLFSCMLATRIISHRLVQASHKTGIRAQKKKSCQKNLKNLTFCKDKKPRNLAKGTVK